MQLRSNGGAPLTLGLTSRLLLCRRFRSPSEIRKAFEDAGVDVDSPLPIITTCGSGVTAAVLTFAFELAGRKAEMSPVYDGAWAEWGSRDDLSKATGKDLD